MTNLLAFVLLIPGMLLGFGLIWLLNRVTMFDFIPGWLIRKYPLAVCSVVLPLLITYLFTDLLKAPLWLSIAMALFLGIPMWHMWIVLYHTGVILIRAEGYRPELDIVPDDGIKRIYMTPEEYQARRN
jgi:hypothetical protein